MFDEARIKLKLGRIVFALWRRQLLEAGCRCELGVETRSRVADDVELAATGSLETRIFHRMINISVQITGAENRVGEYQQRDPENR